eukprot:4122037-Prymnesium_polylepis.1
MHGVAPSLSFWMWLTFAALSSSSATSALSPCADAKKSDSSFSASSDRLSEAPIALSEYRPFPVTYSLAVVPRTRGRWPMMSPEA